MSTGLRNISKEQRLNVVRRRMLAIVKDKDFKPGLGTWAAIDYGEAVERKAEKKAEKSES